MPKPSTACIPYTPPGTHCYPKAFYSVQEVAALLRFTSETVRDMIAAGQLAALRIRRSKRNRYRIPASELVRILTPLSGSRK